MVEQVGVEVLELLLGELDLLERRRDLVEREVALLVAFLDQGLELFDLRKRDIDSQHGPPRMLRFSFTRSRRTPHPSRTKHKTPGRPVGETKRIADARSVQAVIRLGKELSRNGICRLSPRTRSRASRARRRPAGARPDRRPSSGTPARPARPARRRRRSSRAAAAAPRRPPARSPASCRRRSGPRSRCPSLARPMLESALGAALGDAARDRPHRLGVEVAAAAHELGMGRHGRVLARERARAGGRTWWRSPAAGARTRRRRSRRSSSGSRRLDARRAPPSPPAPPAATGGRAAVAGRVPAVVDAVRQEAEVVPGAVVPHPLLAACRASSGAPRRRARRRPGRALTASTWMSWPACDAHITASTRSSSPSASRPPEATSGSAWNGLAAERSVVTRSGSPHAGDQPCRRAAPTTAWTRWRLSGKPFR